MIYILNNGESEEPHKPGEIQEDIDAGELAPDCLACIEGMREWRAVGEALVWARGTLLSEIRDVVWEQVEKLKDGKINDATARAAIRKALPIKRVLDDPKAFESFLLIMQTNANLLRNIEHIDYSADELELYPGFNLYEISTPQFPRDWQAAWTKAGGGLYDGRMVARKDDPVWLALSDFGYPFPPFSFDQAYWTDNVSRAECTKLGVIANGVIPQPVKIDKKFDLVGIP
jgi:hypothetical protein